MGFDEALAAIRDWLGAALLAERERWILWLSAILRREPGIDADLARFFTSPTPQRVYEWLSIA